MINKLIDSSMIDDSSMIVDGSIHYMFKKINRMNLDI